ncbi:MAG: PepSY domain-containing protein [Mesorhizobium sp.]
MMSFRQVALAAALAFIPASALADDRPPTAEERVKIEAALKAAGYSSWEEIELDDNDGWEVDDALFTDGKKYDLKLDPATLAIVDRDD